MVTGADGFVGAPLVHHLAASGHEVVAAVRTLRAQSPSSYVKYRVIGDIERQPHWAPLLERVDAVVHLAGRAHILRRDSDDPLTTARQANVAPTLALFEACQRAGTARFVYVSSIHVLGHTSGPQAFTERDTPHPGDPYAQSKWEAERGLAALSSRNQVPQLTVVRPTVVCGPHAKGNLARLVRLVARDLPLPFGAVTAGRHFVGLSNLCDLLERCATHAAAGGKTYLAADPEALSLPMLIRTLASALHLRARLFPVPPKVLTLLSTLAGQRAQIQRLTEPLLVDATLARHELGWRNDRPLTDELGAMARAVR